MRTDAVIRHFRSDFRLDDIHRLNIPIEVHKTKYTNRKRYFDDLLGTIEKLKQPFVMLLDPDTGIEPKKARNQHLWLEDLKRCWDVLSEGTWLVVYQHGPQRKSKTGDWWKYYAEKFCEGVPGSVETCCFSSPKIASDVVFFAAKR